MCLLEVLQWWSVVFKLTSIKEGNSIPDDKGALIIVDKSVGDAQETKKKQLEGTTHCLKCLYSMFRYVFNGMME